MGDIKMRKPRANERGGGSKQTREIGGREGKICTVNNNKSGGFCTRRDFKPTSDKELGRKRGIWDKACVTDEDERQGSCKQGCITLYVV